ncbi:hypothetical protein AHiyo8_40460 [Arthrobacter sp. Hiyo8]|nr:hypothetical protein AHiyo8_40460 [Arthrobacter sp. Hiyo8]
MAAVGGAVDALAGPRTQQQEEGLTHRSCVRDGGEPSVGRQPQAGRPVAASKSGCTKATDLYLGTLTIRRLS